MALYALQGAGLLTKVASDKFSYTINGKDEKFQRGTVLIPVYGQPLSQDEIFNLVTGTAEDTGIDFYGLSTGLSPEGMDMGSNNFNLLKKPEVLMAAGNSVSSRDAGELWYLFDQNYQIPVTLTDAGSFGSINLSRYNVLILPAGSLSELGGGTVQKIKTWVEEGGTLITGSTGWTTKNELSKIKLKKNSEADSALFLNYADRGRENSLRAIGGAIFKTEMDLTHPLCYGYQSKELAVFKTGNAVVEKLQKKYAEPVKFTEQPYLSGFVSEQNLERIKNAPVVTVESYGRGNVITFHESMAFRGMWKGTNKLFSNAVFFGHTIH
jgi:hypothetical protein